MKPKIYITYEMVFEETPLDISEYLQTLDRDWLIRFALLLIQSNGRYESITQYSSQFFCRENALFLQQVLLRLHQRIQREHNSPAEIIPHEYFIVSETTGLELLRQVFAIEKFEIANSQVLQEQNLFKAILLINANISKAEVKHEYTESGELSDLFFAKSLFCNSLNNHEHNNILPEYLIMLQVIKGFYFFKYCEKSKLKEHLRIFLERNGFSSWKQYLYNAIKLLLFPLKNEKGYTTILLDENGDGYTFLHSHAFSIDSIIAVEENIDYTYFKTHPLIEVNSKTFITVNTRFCVNHLYRSIYFEFKAINEQLKGTKLFLKDRGLWTIFTTEFSEQYMFDTFMRKILKRRNGVKLSDSDCKAITKVGHEPDFYYRDGKNILLFENKDIMIADYVKRSGNYDEIEKALNNKLVNEVGIDQLIYNIRNIASGEFIWDKSIPKNPRVYPILVLDDSSLCVPGLNHILNSAFETKLNSMNLSVKVFPLVVIELDTLIAFVKDFESGKYKLKDVIEKYIIFQNQKPIKEGRKIEAEKIMREVFQKYFPFYHFFAEKFAHKPFDEELFEEICDVLRTSDNTKPSIDD